MSADDFKRWIKYADIINESCDIPVEINNDNIDIWLDLIHDMDVPDSLCSKFDSVIYNNHKYIRKFILNVNSCSMLPKTEDTMLNSFRINYDLFNVLFIYVYRLRKRDRWPELEKFIVDHLNLNRHNDCSRFLTYNEIRELLDRYIERFVFSRWPEIEDKINYDTAIRYIYNTRYIDHRLHDRAIETIEAVANNFVHCDKIVCVNSNNTYETITQYGYIPNINKYLELIKRLGFKPTEQQQTRMNAILSNLNGKRDVHKI